jgi:hypothetical protein
MWFARLTISPNDDGDVSAGSIRRIEGVLVEIILYPCFNCFQIAAEICMVVKWGRSAEVLISLCGCRRGRSVRRAWFRIVPWLLSPSLLLHHMAGL